MATTTSTTTLGCLADSGDKMPLVTQEIKNLKGGISQQPDILRFPDQGNQQINAFSSEVQGLQKRPPSKHIKRLRDQWGLKPLIKLINRDESEKYYVAYEEAGITVWDLQGNKKTVNAPAGWGYLAGTDPRRDIRAVTIADYTFIVNRAVTVTEATTVAYPGYRTDGQCLLNIKGGQYGRTFKVYINDTLVATHTTPNGDAVSQAPQIDTQYITDQINTKIVATFAATPATWSGWTTTMGPNFIKVSAPTGKSVSKLRTEDGFNNGLLTGVIFDSQRFNMLPAQGPDGYIVRVSGDPGSGSDDYYVRYDSVELVWKETIKPGVITEIDKNTMPHVLVREADGTFTFRAADWDKRTAGDDDSNPMPSFVDGKVNDVFFFRNRLGFISGENIILTKSGEFFSFFPKSVVTTADTDPIDVAISHQRVSILNHAVPFAEELLLWSDQTQFVLRADGVLTAKSVKVDPATEFESAVGARPVAAGRSVYFAAPRATFTSIRRYYSVQDVSAVKNADDVSAHVPSYIQNGVFFLGSSTTENVVTVLTSGAESRIYLYKYLYQEEQLVQQSWSHWEFGAGSRILACEFVGAIMYLIIDSPSGVFLETIEFTQNTKDLPDEPFRCYMDRKLAYTAPVGSYKAVTGNTEVPLASLYGAIPAHGDYWLVRSDGRAFFCEEPDGGWVAQGGKLTMPGNQDGKLFIVGESFTFFYEFSKFLIKMQDQNGTKSETVGRLQIRRAWVNYEESGPFTVDVCGEYQYVMSGKRIGTTILGDPATDTGQFRFPVMKNATECRASISSNSPTPLAFIGAGWNGMYFRREQIL